MKKYFIVFTLLLFFPIPVIAEKKRNEFLLPLLFTESIFAGSVFSICQAYTSGWITAEQRNFLYENSRILMFDAFDEFNKRALELGEENTMRDPKEKEISVIQSNHKLVNPIGVKCFPETDIEQGVEQK